MTPHEFTDALDAIPTDDTDKLEALAAQVLAQARALPDLAGTWFADPKALDRARKSQLLLGDLEELSILPLIAAPADLPTDRAAWRSTTLAEAAIQLRRKVVLALDAAMKDKRPVPLPPALPHVEQRPQPRRICDEAYLNARRLLNIDEPMGQSLMNAREFLSFPDEKKDAEIAAYQKSRTWTQFTEPIGF